MTLWLVLTVSLLLGLAHAAYVHSAARSGSGGSVPPERPHPLGYGAWTLVLWLVLGPYVIGLWLLGAVLYGVSRLFRW